MLAFFAKLPQLSIAIIAVIVLNGVFALIQQARADRAADRLQQMLPTRITVWRDGRRQVIEAEDVVVDDILLLESGDRVPADAVVLTENRLLVDSSMLTGESVAGAVAVGDALFAGTFVVEGDTCARVTAIGQHTRLAVIARLTTSTTKPDTPLTRACAVWSASPQRSPSASESSSSSSRYSSATPSSRPSCSRSGSRWRWSRRRCCRR
ncbi:E1-E2 ATPase family protein [Mycobacterium kansasii 824]|nr:E1-E2 ATPase family protein [Mycobacterium kansasii 824]